MSDHTTTEDWLNYQLLHDDQHETTTITTTMYQQKLATFNHINIRDININK